MTLGWSLAIGGLILIGILVLVAMRGGGSDTRKRWPRRLVSRHKGIFTPGLNTEHPAETQKTPTQDTPPAPSKTEPTKD